MSLFRGLLNESVHRGFTRLIIRRAKLNWKYRRGNKWDDQKKKYRRRIKDPDLDVLQVFCSEEGIDFGYDGTTDDIWFETHVESEGSKNDIELDGWNTGGQIIRLFLAAAINSVEDSCRSVPTTLQIAPFLEADRASGRNGKACMLYVQARLWTLRVGDSFTVVGGDPLNDDALAAHEHEPLFHVVRQVLGRNFTLRDQTGEDGVANFVVTRHDDTAPSSTEITTDTHTVDQLVMGAILIFQKNAMVPNKQVNSGHIISSPSRITIRCPPSRDYHPDAVIRVGRLFGMEIEDTKPLDGEEISEWLEAGKERIITLF